MRERTYTMSRKELDRVAVIQQVVEKSLKQSQAAQQLGITTRQVRRLVNRYRIEGKAGLISSRRGRPSNNCLKKSIRLQALDLVRQHYSDFGPTLACEKLIERHDLTVSRETLRQWMVAEGQWQTKSRRRAHIHQRRPRRSHFGELVQIDGSPHDWFEERGARCTLIVFIDDATSLLTALRFVPTETTHAYMETLEDHLERYGRPVALYSDKHGIFRVNHPNKEGELTQFTRALKTLDIEPIHANTPQAKGRVERANKTLQDRLVKELRLQGIDTMEEANLFLPRFMEDHNRRFAVKPRHPADTHRKVLHNPEELELILSLHHTRKLTKNLALQFQNVEYQLQGYGKGYRMRGATVTVCEAFDGSVTLLHKGHTLNFRILQQGERPIPVVDEKSIHAQVEQVKQRQQQKPAWKPPVDHPWRHSNIHYATPQT